MTTILEVLRERARAAQVRYERSHVRLFRDAERRTRMYSDAEHDGRVLALRKERSEELDGVIEEARRTADGARQEIAALENGDPTALLGPEELASASARKGFVSEDVWNTLPDRLAGKLRAVLGGGDRAATFCYWRSAAARNAVLQDRDLTEVLDEIRDALAGPERLRTVERARATMEEAVGVEMLAGNLKAGAASAAGAWRNRRYGAA